VEKVNGANAAELTSAISKQSKNANIIDVAPQSQGPDAPLESINDRLKRLTTMAPAVLFMKGMV
jgi:hypothetical protein